MDALTLRPTTAQLRNLLLATWASGVVAVLLTYDHLAGPDASDRILGWGIAAEALMLLTAWATVTYSRAVTECTEGGIRVRGLTGMERHCRWEQVSGVAIRIGRRGATRTVMLTLTGGEQVLLGAPVTGGLMRDRDFDTKAVQIHQFWQRATRRDCGVLPIPVLPPTAYRVTARSTLVGLVTLTALGLTAALPVLAREGGQALLVRLGQGRPGYFTAYFASCSGTCGRVGEFIGSGSLRLHLMTMSPGATIPPTGGPVPAVDIGKTGLVYPAGGGSGWIPLATVLALAAACLVVDAFWVMSRVRQQRVRRELQPWSGAPTAAMVAAPAGPARPLFARTPVTAGAACLAIAGTLAALLLLPLPSHALPPAEARACADFGEWLAAQQGTGQPSTDVAAVTRATQTAPNGTLGNDLARLNADVKTAAQLAQSLAGVDAQVSVTTDMQAVGHDCFG